MSLVSYFQRAAPKNIKIKCLNLVGLSLQGSRDFEVTVDEAVVVGGVGGGIGVASSGSSKQSSIISIGRKKYFLAHI